MKKNLWIVISLLLVSAMVISGCSFQAAPAAPKVLKARLIRDITNLDTANVTGHVEDTDRPGRYGRPVPL